MVFELQRADGVRHAFDGIGLTVREIVARIDAPGRPGARMRGMQDAVEHRIAQVDVACRHVDLGPQDARAVGNSPARMRRNRSRFSSTVRSRNGLLRPGFGQRPARRAHLLL